MIQSPTNGPALTFTADGKCDGRMLFGIPDHDPYYRLVQWANGTPGLHAFTHDFHRLQVEYWVWVKVKEEQARLASQPCPVFDIGVYEPRAWVGPDYQPVGVDATGDTHGLSLDVVTDAPVTPARIVICTEVLEHCIDPFAAARNLLRWLEPGGLLVATGPFIWPDHRTEHYPDYWRFTEQGWRVLLADWEDVLVQPCGWSKGGHAAWYLLRDMESMGTMPDQRGATGYLVTARRPCA